MNSTLTRRFAPPSPSGRGTILKSFPLPLGEGGAKRRVRVEFFNTSPLAMNYKGAMDSRVSNPVYRLVWLVFGIPFTGIGLLAILVGSYRYLTGVTDLMQTVLLAIFGLMFCGIAAGRSYS